MPERRSIPKSLKINPLKIQSNHPNPVFLHAQHGTKIPIRIPAGQVLKILVLFDLEVKRDGSAILFFGGGGELVLAGPSFGLGLQVAVVGG